MDGDFVDLQTAAVGTSSPACCSMLAGMSSRSTTGACSPCRWASCGKSATDCLNRFWPRGLFVQAPVLANDQI